MSQRAMIAGVGLIGGSIGMALREQGWHVSGVDKDNNRLSEAKELGAIVISHSKNQGYGATIRSIFLKAKEIDADVETIEWKNWSSVVEDGLCDDNHLVIPVNKNLSGASIRGYKEGGRVGSLANVNVLDLGERVNG